MNASNIIFQHSSRSFPRYHQHIPFSKTTSKAWPHRSPSPFPHTPSLLNKLKQQEVFPPPSRRASKQNLLTSGSARDTDMASNISEGDQKRNGWSIATPLITTFVAVAVVFYAIWKMRLWKMRQHHQKQDSLPIGSQPSGIDAAQEDKAYP